MMPPVTTFGFTAEEAQLFAGDPAKAIAVDAANNFYITGDYTGTATFDGLTVPNTGTKRHRYLSGQV